MKRILLASCSLILLGACQPIEPEEPLEAEATETEKSQVAQWFTDCVKAAAATLDDHVSDAMTIANVIVSGRCAPKASQLVNTYTRGSNWRVKAMVEDDLYNGGLQEMAAQVVLVQRSRRLTP